MTDKRIEFDFELEFTNGGGLTGSGFRLDVPNAEVSDDWLAQALVRSTPTPGSPHRVRPRR